MHKSLSTNFFNKLDDSDFVHFFKFENIFWDLATFT